MTYIVPFPRWDNLLPRISALRNRREQCVQKKAVYHIQLQGKKKRALLLSSITNQASLKYADRGQQFFHCHFMSSDQVASGTHHPSSKRSSDSASFVRLLKELIKLSVLCHSTGGCVILLATSGILVLFKVPYFSIPVCLLLCGKEQDTNTSLDRALKKRS